jgi:hypothetical protein
MYTFIFSFYEKKSPTEVELSWEGFNPLLIFN